MRTVFAMRGCRSGHARPGPATPQRTMPRTRGRRNPQYACVSIRDTRCVHTGLDNERLHRLLDAGRAVTSQLSLERVLERVLDAAQDITGARYAALGVLDADRRRLERF